MQLLLAHGLDHGFRRAPELALLLIATLAASAAPAAICWAFDLAGMIPDLPGARARHRHSSASRVY
jgi:hypothetical protein